MKRLVILGALGLLLAAGQAFAVRDDGAAQAEVRQGFEQILDFWRDGRFVELYDRTSGGKMTREAFVKRFAAAELKPTCCWDKLQEVTVTMQTASKATLRGTVGLESAIGSETKTKSFKLTKVGGVWQVSQAELTALAGGAKKKQGKKSVLHKAP